jgi:hypothetical protein
VGNILRRYGIQPAPKRSQNTIWKDFIASHMAVLAGIDFFTLEVLTWRGLATYYVLFFIHLESRRGSLAGLTKHPTCEWMLQMARNREKVRYAGRCTNTSIIITLNGWPPLTGKESYGFFASGRANAM